MNHPTPLSCKLERPSTLRPLRREATEYGGPVSGIRLTEGGSGKKFGASSTLRF